MSDNQESSQQTTAKRRLDFCHILVMPEFKPGDLPPDGYLQWHEWAEVQRKAGIRQVQCPTCALWRTPQELSTQEKSWTVRDGRGREMTLSAFECSQCVERRPMNV